MGKELKMKRMTSLVMCITMLFMLLSCSADDGLVDQEIAVEAVEMNTTLETLPVGESAQIQIAINPEEATDPTVFWSSSKEDIATVDQAGVITAHSEGQVRILAVSVDNPRKSDAIEIQIIK